jgi:hypothetical protein
MVAATIFVMAYLWLQHRNLKQPDPSTDVFAYQKALLERFDQQIRLLIRVKYWYLTPLYLPILWMNLEKFSIHPWGSCFSIAIVTALYGFIGWLNEKAAVGTLKNARKQLLAMIEEREKIVQTQSASRI